MDKLSPVKADDSGVYSKLDSVSIDFSTLRTFATKAQEIKNSVIEGQYREQHAIRPANVVLSKMLKFYSENGSLEYVDFKDSHIEQSGFLRTSFDYGAVINCEFNSVVFEDCNFHNVSISACTFTSVKFMDCNLDHMVIEGCKFIDCEFINCSTSNKLFEFCLFSDTRFDSTNIQLQTILDNLGLSKTMIRNSQIRDRSVDEEFSVINIEEEINGSEYSAFGRMSIEFYLESNLLHDLNGLEDLLTVEAWREVARVPVTFLNTLKLLYEFIVDLYHRNLCTLLPLLKLHNLTNLFIESRAIPENHLISVYGIHMGLTKYTEEFLSLCESTIRKLENPVILLANGPDNKEFYIDSLPFLEGVRGLQVLKVVKHNSPNEIFVAWSSYADLLPMVALLLATRIKLEVKQFKNDDLKEETINTTLPAIKAASAQGASLQKFELNFGLGSGNAAHQYGLKLKSIFPGELLVEFGLHISLKKAAEVKNILIRIISSLDSKGGENS